MLNLKKQEVQQKAFDAWNVDKFGSVLMHTGTGKTFLMFKCLLETNCKQVLLLAETTLREKSIKDDALEYKKHYGIDPFLGKKVIFMCYQSAYKIDLQSIFDGSVFVFADEVHELATQARWDFVENSDWADAYFLGVTATLDKYTLFKFGEEEHTKWDKINNFASVCYEYHIDQARQDETTRNLQIYVYNHKLDKIKPDIQATKTWKDTEFKVSQWLDGAFRKAVFMRGTETEKKAYFNMLMRKRNGLLYNLPSKIIACKRLLQHLPGRTIVFGNTTESLSQLGIPIVVAENKSFAKDLDRFQTGDFNQIGSNKMLLQGANLKDLDNIILLSYYGKPGPLVQRLGRLRSADSIGKVIIFKTQESQEVKWFEEMMEPMSGFNQISINNILNCL